ncbi:hypothetical protein [Phenylobacterium sp.]|uniref:hypothetical protein n=1 Tax=Phenylobacterium sp. TaxID=1871053 RepID=UPI002DF43676|nr:hypothetical protein [Phenylobacterium sp.]
MTRSLASALVLSAALLATSAAAQAYSGYEPPAPGVYHPPKFPEPPKPPKPPKPPEFAQPKRFEPFQEQKPPAAPNPLDPYPAPKKPKGGFSPYGGL